MLEHASGTLLVTGPAGTGKTAVLRERFARLVESGADPDRVALVVGSSSAREPPRSRCCSVLPTSLSGLHVVTMHGLANRILKARAEQRARSRPQLLSATEQFAKVQELLAAQDPERVAGLRSAARHARVRRRGAQFLSRAQEALLTPDQIVEAADRRGLTGWRELARFLGEYQEVLDSLNLADFATLLQRAAGAAPEGEPSSITCSSTTTRTRRSPPRPSCSGSGAPDLVVAADPGAHVFSFQGTTGVPLDRSTEVFTGAAHVELATNHRAPGGPAVEAWVAPHTSEEHAAIARELRRLHVEHDVGWNDMAVVVRRQGRTSAGCCGRSTTRASLGRCPSGASLTPSRRPALRARAPVARGRRAPAGGPDRAAPGLRRGGLSPAAARG